MQYLTKDHISPPIFVTKDGMLHPTQKALETNDINRLIELAIYPHYIQEGLAPLGYTDWIFTNNTFIKNILGTKEEIDAAILAQEQENLINNRASMSCSFRQAKLALYRFGLLDAVEEYMKTANRELQIEWETGTIVERTWPPVIIVCEQLNITEEQLDDLFALALSL